MINSSVKNHKIIISEISRSLFVGSDADPMLASLMVSEGHIRGKDGEAALKLTLDSLPSGAWFGLFNFGFCLLLSFRFVILICGQAWDFRLGLFGDEDVLLAVEEDGDHFEGVVHGRDKH